MKHIRTKILATSLLLAALSPTAFAADGTIVFTGEIKGQTCSVAGEGRPAGDFTVVLPNVPSSLLNTGGNIAGNTPFAITLSNCTASLKKAAVYFEAGGNVDAVTGNLNNNAATNGAKNVQIALSNNDGSPIKLGAAYHAQNSKTVDIAGGNATLRYQTQYVATGTASAGLISTTLRYSVVYP